MNKKTGECYIGNTIHEKARASKFKDMNHPYAGRKMEDARRRYDFEYEVLTTIKSKDKKDLKRRLDEYEGYYIKAFNSCNNGYNTGHGGNGTKGVKMPDDQKQKISKALKGKPKPETSEETRKKMSESKKGKTCRRIPVDVTFPDNRVETSLSMTEARKKAGIGNNTLIKHLESGLKTVKGYSFAYSEGSKKHSKTQPMKVVA